MRDVLHHGALLRIPSQRVRALPPSLSNPVDKEDLSRADHLRHPALHPASEFAWIALSEHAEQAASVLVHARAAVPFLWFRDCGGPGHDDLRVHAKRESFRPSP